MSDCEYWEYELAKCKGHVEYQSRITQELQEEICRLLEENERLKIALKILRQDIQRSG